VLFEPRIPDHTASFMSVLPDRSGMAALRGLVGGNTLLRSFVKRFDYGTWFGNGNWGNRR
jgi:hypothetical protein